MTEDNDGDCNSDCDSCVAGVCTTRSADDNTECASCYRCNGITTTCQYYCDGRPSPQEKHFSIPGYDNISKTGGEVKKTFKSGQIVKVVFPPNAIEGTVAAGIELQDKTKVIKNNPLPKDSQIVGDLVADFKAFSEIDKELEFFKEKVSIIFSYTDNQIKEANLNENSLKIYRWDKSNNIWEALETKVDTSLNQVTANASQFTLFALMGQELTKEKPVEEEKPIEEALARIYEGIPTGFTFKNNLSFGISSEEVKYLQIILKQEIGPPTYPEDVPATGFFGPVTESSVIKFQQKYSPDILTPWDLTAGTGFVGKTTREKLNSFLTTVMAEKEETVLEVPLEIPADYKFSKYLWYGQKDEEVKYLQIFLKSQGPEIYPEGLVTGYFKSLTEAALKRFQIKYGIVASEKAEGAGFCGPKTRDKINEILER